MTTTNGLLLRGSLRRGVCVGPGWMVAAGRGAAGWAAVCLAGGRISIMYMVMHRLGDCYTGTIMPPHRSNVTKSKRRWLRRSLLATSLVILIIGGWLLFRSYNRPAEGVVTNQAAKPSAPIEYEVQDGQALSFHHESGYKAKPVQKSAIYSEQYVYSKVDPATASSRNLSVSIRLLTATTLNDEAGYKIRKDNPATYVPSTQDVNEEQVVVFSKSSDGFEQTAFWIHNGKLLSMSLSSNYVTAGKLGTELTDILKSVKWH